MALLAGLASNLVNFLFRYLLKDGDDSTAYAWFHEFFRLVFFMMISIFSFQLTSDIRGILVLVGLGIVELATIYLLMRMHAYSHLSISTIIIRTRLIWVPLIAYLLFRETLKNPEYFGILVLFLGLSVVISPKKIKSDRGFKYAFWAAFAVAWVSIFLKLSAPYASASLRMVFMALPSVLFFPLIMKNGIKRVFKTFKVNLAGKILAGLVASSSTFLLAKAIEVGPVSIVTALYQGMMIASVLAGIVFLKERENAFKKIVGSLIALIGVLLLTCF